MSRQNDRWAEIVSDQRLAASQRGCGRGAAGAWRLREHAPKGPVLGPGWPGVTGRRVTEGSRYPPPTTLRRRSDMLAEASTARGVGSARAGDRWSEWEAEYAPSVMLRHAKYSTATAAVSSIVAMNDPSILLNPP